ncbi:MAG TPA: tryptophan 2,3-dioxygenase family protein [Stellaceae bacterium]|nr:tryptophan 2,3-dioxygenase family protein [Stellaceae bacterium]
MAEHTYASYLKLDELLSAQRSMTESDDELLFIVIHQAHELWFKLAIHELSCATRALMRTGAGKTDCIIAYKRLSRVSEIQRVLIASWSVLTTLTPDEFHVFRLTVGQNGASGFQSIQYRVLEFKLGLKYRTVRFTRPARPRAREEQPSLRFETEERDIFAEARTPEERQALEQAFGEPSIYDAVVHYMARQLRRFGIAPTADYGARHRKQRPIFAAWEYVYHNREKEPELYQLGEKLIDLEDAFRRWRFAHLATVSRVIGNSAGTGGSAGLRYLRDVANQLLDDPIYPELWDIRNALFSRTEFDYAGAGYR